MSDRPQTTVCPPVQPLSGRVQWWRVGMEVQAATCYWLEGREPPRPSCGGGHRACHAALERAGEGERETLMQEPADLGQETDNA